MLDRMLLSAGGEEKLYVEDVFSTYLYTGTGSNQTIANEIDLSGKGGMVWIKRRSSLKTHYVCDTARGAGNYLNTNTTNPSGLDSQSLTSFTATGFTLGSDTLGQNVNYGTTETYASWTFRKAPKFFDVVTWTGDGAVGRQISHNLGTTPGFVIIKSTSNAFDWVCAHRSLSNGSNLYLNQTWAASQDNAVQDLTATTFTVNQYSVANQNGATYVAYLFAHDPTADGIIQCGSFTTDGSNNAPDVNLGWEPQFLIVKAASASQAWYQFDNMRGFNYTQPNFLVPNSSAAESTVSSTTFPQPTATGFKTGQWLASTTYIYIAIRRGPMKTPTVGTSVFSPSLGVSTAPTVPTGFVTDFGFITAKTGGGPQVNSRLTGATYLTTVSTAAEAADANSKFDYMTGWYASALSSTFIGWSFRRAPGFFDEVCYTGTGATRTVNHNLGVAPELMIIKRRSAGGLWYTYWSQLGIDKMVRLNTTDPAYSGFSGILNNTVPSATTFSLATTNSDTNASGSTYVAYLFASCPGVSKIGSYTGNGSSQTINCGFSSGARFFLVKRTDSTGDWWVYDSARGIVAAADPALRLNSTAAEVTSADAVDTDSTGIIVNQEATCNINVNGATYIYLAIA